MKKFKRNLLYILPLVVLFWSCEKDLDIYPKDDDEFTNEDFYANPASYKQYLAKIYAGLALTGQNNVAGASDLGESSQGAVDEGYSQYLRGWWQLQELPTDEAIIAWTDPTLPDLNFATWNADNVYTEAFFARIFFQIGLCNEFLRETTDAKLASRNVSDQQKTEIQRYRAEVRFMRALSYYHGIDIFGKLPFGTDADLLGTPPQMQSREFVFDYVLSELDAINDGLAPPKTNEYARADQAAAWMLKAKLLLNAKVYTGTDRSADALEAVNRVISSGYTLAPVYANLFKADNNANGAQNEVIFPIAYDGIQTGSYGGTTFLVHGGASNPIAIILGVDNGWGGFRVRQEFASSVGSNDARVMYVPGNTDPASITNPTTATSSTAFDQGRKVMKFSNIKADGTPGKNATYPDTDFPLFRLADAYLMYAELAANGFGDKATAVGYVNDLRRRANGTNIQSIGVSELTPDLVLNERAKELYWEGYRRQDLIRFGKFSSGYNWQWKGGIQSGVEIPAYKQLYPIPNKEINTNPKLSQNPGY